MNTAKTDFVSAMLQRTEVIMKMNRFQLPLCFLKEFSLEDLSGCCDRITQSIPEAGFLHETVQRELVRNPDFAEYYARLLSLLSEEAAPQAKPTASPEIQSPRLPYRQSPKPVSAKVSAHAAALGALSQLLGEYQKNGRDITRCPVEDLAAVLNLEKLGSTARMVLLENYAYTALSENDRQALTGGLQYCRSLPLDLSQEQKALLLEPCTASRHLFQYAPFGEVWALLESCPVLLDIARLFHRCRVDEKLGLKEYRSMAQNAGEIHNLLRPILAKLDQETAGRFTACWQRGGCSLYELRRMERWIMEHPGQDWEAQFSAYSGYVNLLYGKRFKSIDLSKAVGYQEDILIYAVIHNKKHFIRLVDEHTEDFMALPYNSILFYERIYREAFNLNELTPRDLKDCAWMWIGLRQAERFLPGRRYTFPELQALYDAPPSYFKLYNALASDSQDHRLKVFRQLRKRKLLWEGIDDGETASLAKCLDRKPLYDWIQNDFRHIEDLTAEDTVRILAHMDKLERLLPDLRCKADAQLALRNLDALESCGSLETLKQNIVRTDPDWRSLYEHMAPSQDFLELYWERVVDFICKGGAYIAETYRKGLQGTQSEAFLRVVKAELMGQLEYLKYFEGDLQHELGLSLSDSTLENWKNRLHLKQDGAEAGEYDDFYSTMLLGVQPRATCLSYSSGAYRHCLLSSFDSNKKILYASLDGRIVGRAFLRLTKGRMTGSDSPVDGRFTFVDLENIQSSRRNLSLESDELTLFLERPYISGVDLKEQAQISRLFVQLAQQKAKCLHTMLILSADYHGDCGTDFVRTQFDIYISKSKAGAQYLDSLDGEAAVSNAGKYATGSFLIWNRQGTLEAPSRFRSNGSEDVTS